MNEHKSASIPTALGLDSEWETKNAEKIISLLKEEEFVSGALVKHAQNIKAEEFGDDVETTLSAYEKKLVWSGMEFARLLIRRNGAPSISTPPLSGFTAFLSLLKEINDADETERKRKKK